jgi:hypothetical protein
VAEVHDLATKVLPNTVKVLLVREVRLPPMASGGSLVLKA